MGKYEKIQEQLRNAHPTRCIGSCAEDFGQETLARGGEARNSVAGGLREGDKKEEAIVSARAAAANEHARRTGSAPASEPVQDGGACIHDNNFYTCRML